VHRAVGEFLDVVVGDEANAVGEGCGFCRGEWLGEVGVEGLADSVGGGAFREGGDSGEIDREVSGLVGEMI